jgi:general secretion pathway protein F
MDGPAAKARTPTWPTGNELPQHDGVTMRYQARIIDGDDRLRTVPVDASDRAEAGRRACAGGATLIGVRRRWLGSLLAPREQRRAVFPVLLFSQELLALLEAGLSLGEALQALLEKERQPAARQTLTALLESISEGQRFATALERAPAVFPPLYVATVRASEQTGGLPEALARYVKYQTQVDAVRSHVISASIYPLLLAGVGALVLLFLLLYVVPRFSRVYLDMGVQLPLMSRLLMQWGDIVDRHGVALLAATVAFGWAGWQVTRLPAARRWLQRRLARLPGIGMRLRVGQLTRFYRCLGMLLRGGTPLLPALQTAAGLLDASLRRRLTLASTNVREGEALSIALDRHGLATPVASRMLRVAERTGRMGEMMERLAAFHEEETARWIARFTKVFEPVLMAFIGLLVGAIVLLMYFPIFELAGSIQ